MNGHESPREPQKELMAVVDSKFRNYYRLKFKEGGKVPENLSGLYSLREANKEIQAYKDGYNRNKIYPKPPKNDKPTRLEMKNGKQEKGDSRVQEL